MLVHSFAIILALAPPVLSAPITTNNNANLTKRGGFVLASYYSPPPCHEGDCPKEALQAWPFWGSKRNSHTDSAVAERRDGERHPWSGWGWRYTWPRKGE